MVAWSFSINIELLSCAATNTLFVIFLLAIVASDYALGYVFKRGKWPLKSISVSKPGLANSSLLTGSVARDEV